MTEHVPLALNVMAIETELWNFQLQWHTREMGRNHETTEYKIDSLHLSKVCPQ